MPQIRFATDALPGGDRFIRTVGLAKLGQTEMGALVQAKRGHQWDHRVIGVLQFLVNYVVGSGARILPERTVEYAWTPLRLPARTLAPFQALETTAVLRDSP